MKTHTIKMYTFDELSDDAKQRALDDNRDYNTHHDYWHECITDDAKTIAALMGIDIDDIWFSGFASQGDGACFEGRYSYRKGSVKAVKDYAPVDETLHRIAAGLQDIQRHHFYGLTATVKHVGHYYHEHCTSIDVDCEHCLTFGDTEDDALGELLRDFMQWIYSQLETEYRYQTSDDAIADSLLANEVEFTSDGKRY